MQKRDGSVRCTGFSIHVLTAGFILTSAFEKRKVVICTALVNNRLFTQCHLVKTLRGGKGSIFREESKLLPFL